MGGLKPMVLIHLSLGLAAFPSHHTIITSVDLATNLAESKGGLKNEENMTGVGGPGT